MKTNLRVQTIIKVTTTLAAGSLALLLCAQPLALADSPSELLEKGIYSEETKGDLNAAVAVYEQIVNHPTAERSIAAQAQLRLGLCRLKLGQKSSAISALEKLTADFPDKEKLLSLVEGQMPLLLDEIVKEIEQNYVKEVDRSDLIATAIQAIIGKLDKQSDFLGTEELARVNRDLEQKIAGVGAQLKFDQPTSQLLVVTPLPGSPALKGGVRAGDRIVEIDGQPVSELPHGKELELAVKLIQGTPGEPVSLGVKHAGAREVEYLHLIRGVVHLPSVLGDHYKSDASWDFMLDDERKIGYLRLGYIGQRSPAEMDAALTELSGRGLKALVLDLRNNPGGLLQQAVEICDLFVESGTIVTVKGRAGKDQVYTAKAEGTYSDFPMVVLVNSNTASASEIVAACLQDHHRVVVVGQRTFGQGLVKSLIKLEGGKSALKLPTSAYYRPNGRNMHRYPESKDSDDWGVRPDDGYEVILSEAEQKDYSKYRSERDIVHGSATIQFSDRQLQRALEYLMSQL